jgi:EAL and modified HD-GYP domain-containing signal transduction protein
VRLELGDTVGSSPESLARLAALKQMGYGLVVDNYWGERERIAPLLPYVDAIKVDLDWVGPTQLAAVVRPFAGGRKALIAEKVESAEQFQLALASGFDLFQGYHFSRPELVKGKRLQVDLSALLRLLNLVTKDADLGDIEAEFKRQPAMSVNLLKLTNSAASGVRTPARSLREAIMRTGLKPMRTWLQLLVYTASGGGGASPLLHTAALRGRLMELLALEASPHDRELADRAMMVGLLSLMHVVFGTTQDAFVADLQLDEDVSAALQARVGALGLLLKLVEAREGATPVEAVLPGIDERVIGRLEVEAFQWASELASAGN